MTGVQTCALPICVCVVCVCVCVCVYDVYIVGRERRERGSVMLACVFSEVGFCHFYFYVSLCLSGGVFIFRSNIINVPHFVAHYLILLIGKRRANGKIELKKCATKCGTDKFAKNQFEPFGFQGIIITY